MDSSTEGMLRMWASKLLLHAKDYARTVRSLRGKYEPNGRLYVGDGRKAYMWIVSDDDSPATFVWVCRLFELDPERTRSKIFHGWRNILAVDTDRAAKAIIENEGDF